MSTLQVNRAGEMTAEISQTVMTEGKSEPKTNDNSKPTSDAVETNSTHSIPDDRAVEDAKERGQNILNESIEAEEKAVASSPDGRFLAFDIEIGRGSFKTVFKGLDTETGVPVAWCELQDKYSKAERSRFKEEAVMLKQLTHPNIVKFHEFFERTGQKDKKQLILVTELMTSGTLKTYLKRFKGVREKVLKSWCRQILEGLYFLHTRTPPVIHRDLKCDNIFVNGATGLIKIGDLGLATLKKHSFAKSVIGTPEFMAPEMYEERYDESVDVYAFGMCMLEMVTLEYPYMECQNAAQIYKRVTQGIPPDCLARVEHKDTYDIIEGCTKYKKNERYTIPYLLKCPFFKLAVGIKVDLVLPLEVDPDKPELVKLQLRLGDPKLRKDKHKDNEAIQFDFDLVKDNPEKISKELVSSGFIDANSTQLAAKTIKECVEAVKKNREKGGMEEKESEAVEKSHHPSESSHNIHTEEHGKSVAEEPSDPSHGRSAVASQSSRSQGQSFHQQPQSTQQAQSQQQQQRNEPESQEVRSRQNSTNEELAAQQAKATASSAASKDSAISNTSVVSSVASEDAGGQRLEPLNVHTTPADAKPGPVSPDAEKSLPTNTESSSTISEKGSNETVSMSSSSNSSTTSLPGSQPTNQTSNQPAQQGQQVAPVAQGQPVNKTKKKERAFKLTLYNVTGDEIECSFDTYKNYRITFKFDINEDESVDIAKSMVDAGHLREANKALFIERLRRILGDARSKKDADDGTVRYEHQTSSESNPGSAHTLPTPTEKNEAFQFPTTPKSQAVSQPSQANVQSTPATQETALQQQGVPAGEKEQVSQQPSTAGNLQQAKSQPIQHAANLQPAPEPVSHVASSQQDQQQPTPRVQPNTQVGKPQPSQQVQQPTPQSKADPPPPTQADTETIPHQANQSVNPPTSLPQPLTSASQDTKLESTTPTEVRTVKANKKQFQVQVLQEPSNVPVTDLPIAPVNSNVPQGPSVNTNVPKDTKVSPVQEGAPSVAAPQTSAQESTTQQSENLNTKTLTENSSKEISSLPTKQPGTSTAAQTQRSDDAQNTSANVAVQSSKTRAASPVQQQQPQVIAKPESAPIARSVATQNTSLETGDVQHATSTQTSLGLEVNIECSEPREIQKENIRVQSPISSHPPIYIPINPGETSKEKNTPSQQSSVDNEKSSKYNEIIALTTSIETQTSFDKNLIQEQPKKATERKTLEKSSSDEHGLDDSDGSSEKSYSRQSSDSCSTQDADNIAVSKNTGMLQAKDIENWLNQGPFEAEGEVPNLSREDNEEMKRLLKKQEREREEMYRRQTRERNELCKKFEQKRNEKLPKDSKRPGGSTSITAKSTTTSTQTVLEQKSSNGHNIKTTLGKKQIHHSDENLKKLQERSMQQFEYDVSKKKGGGGTKGVWPSNNTRPFNKGPPVTAPMVMKGPRGVVPTSSSSMPHIPQSGAGYNIPHTSSSVVFPSPQNNPIQSHMHTNVYWTNGANQTWQTNVETGNGRGQPVPYPDTSRHVPDMNSWQTNGPYHPAATQPPQLTQANNPPRTEGQMASENGKHVVLPSR